MKNFRKTKIVATLGPATANPDMIEALIRQGVNVFRLNFSHGSHEDHLVTLNTIRSISQEKELNVAVLQDLQGPKIRIGEVENGEVELIDGSLFCITTETCVATAERASVSYPYLMEDIEVGSRVLIDDGHMELKVEEKTEQELVCRVVHGGPLRPKKGVNFPDAALQIAALSEKDKRDLAFAVQHKVDFIAVSFVQRPADVMEAKDYLTSKGAYIPVIAKIERQEAINNIEAIIDIADGVMVARGDLGVEIPTEDVPLAQKKIIRLSNRAGKPVITATQMLDSMIHSPRPTRAEASDVANAILDGTDAVMLSNETATGRFPLEAVETMHNIALTIEAEMARNASRRLPNQPAQNIAAAVGTAACQMAHHLHATAIITATLGGSITRQVAKHRPSMVVIAATPHQKTCREMNLLWGTYPILITPSEDTDTLMRTILDQAIQHELVSQGDTVIMTAGIPAGQPGSTNMVKVETVTKVLANGMGLGHKIVSGRAVLAHTAEEAMSKVQEGDILITTMTTRDYMPLMDRISGIITSEGGLTSHAAIVGMSLGIPVLLGVANAFEIIREEGQITIDPNQGLIFTGIPNIT
ncbi:pyruvate kinase [bacterium (Candidatus Blackallbacteria) CG17_big_fil_post_rev_8_21_14_2_50_48_46]|uniref:Pyruvate kinase n=1 Tax=bacterium (Candidatus Blackallbacteria) CG17_big_fil_post_rev_8_21_14_2_50_48_46 TaxID=2014261 RepID=A0A2M7FYD2_9BACT|nr:MAG: pyruvate kinase [bacterium (Candidatus Blackallbacteria) CG18_big_fil_WC_8_21_14_2_50_49_26]PIW14337.1 MAG: pyruvate kinase [bacterium (Candidatus Blackallbacteria) CG17_big_fil_post_rev_8_21_14_2_50_48_46]PIW45606.1 MAG: pyruvate kinase [bacterium (Candidatus Blackallbacteria) CG13_big_fil_rev_8_21_14_2_50_49_14]